MLRIKFQILSDIHLEKRKTFQHPIKAENLILAGDIGNPLMNNYKEYIKYSSHNHKRVFLITGNHEYWKNTYEGTNKLIYDICIKYNNVIFLNNRFYDFESNNRNIRIFGSTLWTEILTSHPLYGSPEKSSDNRLIGNFNFNLRNKLFYDTIKNHQQSV